MISTKFKGKLIFITNEQHRSITTDQFSEANNKDNEDKKEVEAPTNMKEDYDVSKNWIKI